MSNYTPPLKTRPQVFDEAKRDARQYGYGWLRMRPDGTVERIDPDTVYIKPKESLDGDD